MLVVLFQFFATIFRSQEIRIQYNHRGLIVVSALHPHNETALKWLQKTSLTRKKPKGQPSAEKVITSVNFDCEGVFYTEFMTKGTLTPNSANAYCKTLQNLTYSTAR